MKILITTLILITSLYATSIDDFIDKSKCDRLINNKLYSICYSYENKCAFSGWTVLQGDKVSSLNIRKRLSFHPDLTIPKEYRTYSDDYTGYGDLWNRGHFIIADADSDYSKESLYLAYNMAQILPQSAKVNQKTWANIEKYGRELAIKYDYITSISIAEYKNNNIMSNGINIPSGFYRIYYNDKYNIKECYHYDNVFKVDYKHDTVKQHLVDCDTIKP